MQFQNILEFFLLLPPTFVGNVITYAVQYIVEVCGPTHFMSLYFKYEYIAGLSMKSNELL